MAKNLEVHVEGTTLHVTCDMKQNFGPSKSLKSLIVSSSEGYVDVPGEDGLKFNFNLIPS